MRVLLVCGFSVLPNLLKTGWNHSSCAASAIEYFIIDSVCYGVSCATKNLLGYIFSLYVL